MPRETVEPDDLDEEIDEEIDEEEPGDVDPDEVEPDDPVADPEPETKKTKKGKKSPGRPKGAKNKAAKTGYGIVLVGARPAKVEVVSVRGETAKVRKPGTSDTPTRIPSSQLRQFSQETYEELAERWEKISAAMDKSIAMFQKLESFRAKPVVRRSRKGDPLSALL